MRCAVSAGSWHAQTPAAVTAPLRLCVLLRHSRVCAAALGVPLPVCTAAPGAVLILRLPNKKRTGLACWEPDTETVPLRSRPRLRRGVQAGFRCRASAGAGSATAGRRALALGTRNAGAFTMSSLSGCEHARRRCASAALRSSRRPRRVTPPFARTHWSIRRAAAPVPVPEYSLTMHSTDSQPPARGRVLVAQGCARGGCRHFALAALGKGSGSQPRRQGCSAKEHCSWCAQPCARFALRSHDAACPAPYSCAGPAVVPNAKPEAAPKSETPSSAVPPEAKTVLVTHACPPQVRSHMIHGSTGAVC